MIKPSRHRPHSGRRRHRQAESAGTARGDRSEQVDSTRGAGAHTRGGAAAGPILRSARQRPFRPDPSPVQLAVEVIRAADRAHPADAVLRQRLRVARPLAPEDARDAAEAVFAYYRWRGWLDLQAPLEKQLARARQLADEFARNPSGTSDTALLTRAIPGWVGQHAPISVGWLRTLQSGPRMWLRARAGGREALAAALGDCRPAAFSALTECLEYRGQRDLFATTHFQAGQFEIQDIGSQAVSVMCDPKPGETWWDACAGEGGKLLHLSDLMRNTGVIWASDRATWRLEKLKARAARAGVFNYRIKPWDGRERLPTKTVFDGVLVDAPCSGLGTWQRNPHARWTVSPADVAELATVQLRLLSHAAAAVKPGGRIIYAVCTLTRAETIEIADRFQEARPGFAPCAAVNPFRPDDAPEPRVWFRPQDMGGNGMFVATWRKEG